MRNKIKFGRIALHSSVLLSLLASVACQTTRLPTAIKNSDNSAMTVQVSDDRKSLMWSSHASAGKNKETLAVAKLQGNDAAGLQLKAELALLGRMTQAASENARAVLRRDVRNVKAMKTLAKAALMEGKSHLAMTLCESALGLAPQDAEIFSLQGLAQLQLDHPLYAKALWSRALALDPGHVPTLMNMAVFHFQNGNVNRAGAHFDKVLALVPQHLDAQVGRAVVLSAQGQAETAIAALESILKKTGDHSLVLENLAIISRDRLKDYKKASGYVERALALGQTDRKSLETAVGMKHELRRLIAAQEKQLSDESLREMASSKSAQGTQLVEQSSSDSNSNVSSEIYKMEESLK